MTGADCGTAFTQSGTRYALFCQYDGRSAGQVLGGTELKELEYMHE